MLVHILLLYTICGTDGQNNINPVDSTPNSVHKSWDTYISTIIQVTKEQFGNMKSNVLNNYNLRQNEINHVSQSFYGIQDKYVKIMLSDVKKLTKSPSFDLEDDVMIEVMELSSFILEKLLAFHLKGIQGMMLLPMNWYNQTLRDKIQRQQVKIASNNIEVYICEKLELCRERNLYSNYLVDWIRRLMGAGARELEFFFNRVPDVLDKHKHFLKSNIKFRNTIKYIVDSNAIVKRDTLDFVDEILTNQDNVYNLTPAALKKSVSILNEMFRVIDDSYDVNDDNLKALDDITDNLSWWLRGKEVGIQTIQNSIIENMKLNLKIWPLSTQNKIDYLWTQVILL